MLNRIFIVYKSTTEEMYFASRFKDDEKVKRDLAEFEANGWKFRMLLLSGDEDYYAVKFKYGFNKHLLYREIYQMGAENDDDETFEVKRNLLFSSARKLVIIALKIIENGYDIEIPELVHHYINVYNVEDQSDFKEMVFS